MNGRNGLSGLIVALIALCGCGSGGSSSSGGSGGSGGIHLAPGDVVVYGATPSGIIAAIEASQHVKQVTLIEPSQHVGGMSTNGLGASDSYSLAAVGGLAKTFYANVYLQYGRIAAAALGRDFEPHVAEQVYLGMLSQEPNIALSMGETLQSVQMQNGTIASLTTAKGHVFAGNVFIDASYTGDLMAAAKVTYTVGRESSAQYNESYGGVGTPALMRGADIDPYRTPGDPASGLVAHVTADTLAAPGAADQAVMAYNYRLCLSSDPANEIPFAAPAHYDASEFAVDLRWFASSAAPAALSDIVGLAGLPNNKFDLNSNFPLSTDEPGESFAYPDGSPGTRQSIEAEQKRYTQALLYFLASDPRVPAAIQRQLNALGLCKDEFTDNGGWPRQLYVREARRMIGAYVLTQNDLQLLTTIPDSVGVGGYPMDDHINYLSNIDGRVYFERKQGLGPTPYPIPYRSLTPKAAEATNLLVSVDVSASHVAYDSLRVEVTYMILGQAAGAAASLAVENGTSVQNVSYSALSQLLSSEGAVLNPP